MNKLGAFLGAILGLLIVLIIMRLPFWDVLGDEQPHVSLPLIIGLFYGALCGAIFTHQFAARYRLSISILAGLMVTALCVPVFVFICTFCFLMAAAA